MSSQGTLNNCSTCFISPILITVAPACFSAFSRYRSGYRTRCSKLLYGFHTSVSSICTSTGRLPRASRLADASRSSKICFQTDFGSFGKTVDGLEIMILSFYFSVVSVLLDNKHWYVHSTDQYLSNANPLTMVLHYCHHVSCPAHPIFTGLNDTTKKRRFLVAIKHETCPTQPSALRYCKP